MKPFKSINICSKGAEKNGKSPDGTSFLDSTEIEEIKALLK